MTTLVSIFLVLLAILIRFPTSSSSLPENSMVWRKFHTVDDVPSEYYDKHKSIHALVERVIDGDTIRVKHIPGYTWRRWKTPQSLQEQGHKGGIVDHTLIVRIYGVDCPELAKFGRSGQPFAQQAKDYTSRLVLHRVVKITFYRKDQYRRAICKVETVPSRLIAWMLPILVRPKDLSVELAKAGLAELYMGGGAEYCNNRELLVKSIEKAKRQGKGMWSLGATYESAADYKRNQTKNGGAGNGATFPSNKDKNRIQRHRGKVLDSVVTGLELAVG